MKSRRWSVYKVEDGEPVPLGYVNAPVSPHALRKAWEYWPEELDNSQVQRGLSVRLYETDALSLGKLHKKGTDQ